MATIVFEAVMVAVVSNSLSVLLYSGCWSMLDAAVEKLASMHHTTSRLLLLDSVMPRKKRVVSAQLFFF